MAPHGQSGQRDSMKGPADGRGSRVGKALVQLSGLVALLALRLSHKAHVGACGWGRGRCGGRHTHPGSCWSPVEGGQPQRMLTAKDNSRWSEVTALGRSLLCSRGCATGLPGPMGHMQGCKMPGRSPGPTAGRDHNSPAPATRQGHPPLGGPPPPPGRVRKGFNRHALCL